MGFRLDRTYVLEFEGAMQGAEIAIKATSVGVALKLRSTTDPAEVVGLLVDHLIGWNLEDSGGNPLPMTAEAILDNLELPVVERIGREWYKAATGVTAPLDGTDSMETGLEMEPISDN